MATWSSLIVLERQMVQMLIANTNRQMKRGLINACCLSNLTLYEVTTLVKKNIYEFVKIEEPTREPNEELFEGITGDINQVVSN